MTNLSVRDLIEKRGGVDEISMATQRTDYPVTPGAVHKWRKNGIPDEHWPIFISVGVSVEVLFRANEQLRKSKLGRDENAVPTRRRASGRVAA